MVCSESYVKAFQYKVLNSILYTNAKLCKIGYIAEDKCTFCKSESETLKGPSQPPPFSMTSKLLI